MMKKILNEWRRFTLTEAARTNEDDLLGAPDGWFTTFNRTVGDLTDKREWFSKLQTPEAKSFLQRLEDRAIESGIRSGLSFHVRNHESELGIPIDELIRLKAEIYMNAPDVPQEHKDFLRENFDRIFELAKPSASTNRGVHGTGATFKGQTAFFGSAIDYALFGDLIDKTEAIFREVVQPTSTGGSRPPMPPTPPPTPSRRNSRMDDMMAAMAALQRNR